MRTADRLEIISRLPDGMMRQILITEDSDFIARAQHTFGNWCAKKGYRESYILRTQRGLVFHYHPDSNK